MVENYANDLIEKEFKKFANLQRIVYVSSHIGRIIRNIVSNRLVDN